MLFFGLLIALNIQTSFLSPPVAMAPFYLKGVAPKEVGLLIMRYKAVKCVRRAVGLAGLARPFCC